MATEKEKTFVNTKMDIETVEMLDAMCESDTVDGEVPSRSSMIRKFIRQEFARRNGQLIPGRIVAPETRVAA